MTRKYLLGIDQGTSGSKAVIIDGEGRVCGVGFCPLVRLYPQPGYVEQEPTAVVSGVRQAVAQALVEAGIRPNQLLAAGIACQRNSAFAWDSHSGQPIGNVITWQDLRTTELVAEAKARFDFHDAWRRLGYPPGPYMAALHLGWRMRHDADFRDAADAGRLRIGLSAEYLIHALGQLDGHQMDASLVQALGVYDFRDGALWQPWLAWLGVPPDALPQPTRTLSAYGTLTIDGSAVPVVAQLGDQQAALFGQRCWQPGSAECTHGTASYVKVNVGARAPLSDQINVYQAWHLDAEPTYCLEAPTTVTGAAIRWMQDNLRLFANPDAMEQLAASVTDSSGVVFVPALTGLEVPYHKPNVRGTLLGLTLGHTRAHVVRAFLEAIGFQLRAILDTVRQESGISVPELVVGGGVSASDMACQIQADMTGIPVVRPTFKQMTGYAAALMAGLGAGVWTDSAEIPPLDDTPTLFHPGIDDVTRQTRYDQWQRAITLAQAW